MNLWYLKKKKKSGTQIVSAVENQTEHESGSLNNDGEARRTQGEMYADFSYNKLAALRSAVFSSQLTKDPILGKEGS